MNGYDRKQINRRNNGIGHVTFSLDELVFHIRNCEPIAKGIFYKYLELKQLHKEKIKNLTEEDITGGSVLRVCDNTMVVVNETGSNDHETNEMITAMDSHKTVKHSILSFWRSRIKPYFLGEVNNIEKLG